MVHEPYDEEFRKRKLKEIIDRKNIEKSRDLKYNDIPENDLDVKFVTVFSKLFFKFDFFESLNIALGRVQHRDDEPSLRAGATSDGLRVRVAWRSGCSLFKLLYRSNFPRGCGRAGF